MKISDSGVVGSSFMDFTIPSEFAKNALYYCPQFGHYYCDNRYSVSREEWDWFLLMYLRHGMLYVDTGGHTYTAVEGEAVLLDCRTPHRYYCKDTAEFLWFHFSGNSSAAYAEYLYAQSGVVFSGLHIQETEKYFLELFQIARSEIVDEHRVSLFIHQILCGLVDTAQSTRVMNVLLRPAISFIHEHYQENIDLDRLAQLCRISRPHLVRCFRKYANCTPHEYLLLYRLRQAKQKLVNSHASVEQIAERCGFNSGSHFARAFRQNCGMSPSEFRNLQF